MSVQSDSVLDLIGKLCELHLGEKKRCHLVQPKVDRDVHFQRMKLKAFDVLFNFLKSPESKESGVSSAGIRVEVDQVLQNVFHLRLQRRFEDADRLECLLEQILGSSAEEDLCMLRFLTRLAGTGPSVSSTPLGHDLYNTPVASEDTLKPTTIPPGPPSYSDSRQVVALSNSALVPYMHFPPQLFEAHTPTAVDVHLPQQARPQSIFTQPPGTSISGGSLFSVEREHRDQHEQDTHLSLFGGLVHARGTSLATKLDLPDLPDDPQASPPEITVPKAISMSELSDDEGFITTDVSSSATTPADSFLEEDIWELALTTTPCQHYVWERIGCEPIVTERGYLTEAGPQAVDELCHLRRHHEHLLDPSTCQPPQRQVSCAQLIKDVIYLLIGFPSCTFPFSQDHESFTIDQSVTVSGLSPESLHNFLADFVECGTLYHHLVAFSAPLELDSQYTGGLVLQAYMGAVRSVLQSYRAAVLSMPTDLTLLALRMHCGKALAQIRFMAELCQCEGKFPGATTDSSFPVGVPLISYIYQETLDAVNTDNYLLMLFLLRTTCQPFVLFVQDWVFHGTFRDVYGEFMIQTNPEFLEAKDELYWEKGFTLATEDEAASVPTFLVHLAPAIFRCGKALNLLRMCSPGHFLCCANDSEIPRVLLSYARSDLSDISLQCEMYVSRMRQIARQLTMSRAEQLRRAKQAQTELLETARRMAAMEIARLEGILVERKQKADAKKRKEFKRLKDQMTSDLQRRADEEAEAKGEDRQLMARLTRQEEALTEQEIELEKQARDELVAYYTSLGEEAAWRERRALWRIRRARLETARIEHLMAEDAKWKAEMEEQKQAQDLLQKSEEVDSLPDWAQRLEGNTEPLQVGGMEQWQAQAAQQSKDRDWSVPKWAERAAMSGDSSPVEDDAQDNKERKRAVSESVHNLSSTSGTTVGVSETSSPNQLQHNSIEAENRMPAWAKNVLSQSGETVVVDDDETEDTESDVVSGDDIQEEEASQQPSASDSASVSKNSSSVVQSQAKDSPLHGSGSVKPLPVLGGSGRKKNAIQFVRGTSINQETEEGHSRPHIQISSIANATAESNGIEDQRPHIKQVAGASATKETEPEESQRQHIKVFSGMSATQETQEDVQRPHLKGVANRGSTLQSKEEVQTIPKLGNSSQSNITTETAPSEWKIKKRSLFGHASELSKQDYTFQAPRLKRHLDRNASLESDFREFTVKPRIRLHKSRSAVAESEEQVDRPQIRSYAGRHATQESEYVDVDSMRRKRFLEQNVFGHTSDSSVQRLLYGEKFGTGKDQAMEVIPEALELIPRFEMSTLNLMPDRLEKFNDNFDHLNTQPIVDLVASIPGVVQGGLGSGGGEIELSQEDSEAIAFTPLSKLLQQALTAPLTAQISLVNETVVNYFLVELKIDSHFEALHRYLFMADGDFAQNLTDILLEKFSSCKLPQEMLTPVFLNSALNRALQLSASSSQEYGDNLSFVVRYTPDFFRHNAHDALDCLELRYKVNWPLNVVLTEASQACYRKVFSFMLQLKRVVWTLTDCWYRLKRDAIVKKAKDSSQFRQLQLHRHEMQHFVRVIQGYMANQIIQVTWKELQESLTSQVHSLDDLRHVHADYLHKALFRCLLNKKAVPIMKIIQDIFCLILKFCSQLANATWGQDPVTGEVTHPNFSAMVSSYKAFKEFFVFLFKVVNKLAVRGYQPHLHELLLRLNFNNYYSS